MATGRTSPFPPSGNEGYLCNRAFPFSRSRSTYIGMTDEYDPYQSATGAAPFQRSVNKPPVPPCLRTVGQGKHRECRSLLFPKTHSVRLLDNTGKAYPFTGKDRCRRPHPSPKGVMWRKYIWTNHVELTNMEVLGDSNLTRYGFSQWERHGLRLGANPWNNTYGSP